MEKLSYLLLSVVLSSGRNIISKKTAVQVNGHADFFLSQTLLFGGATVLLLLFAIKDLTSLAPVTFIYGIVYGVLLILSQWMFTIALKSGNTSVCSVVYSLGFILPTVSGALFWHEGLTVFDILGVFMAVSIILFTSKKSEKGAKRDDRSFIPFILIAMISSGGLGIMQKVQQTSTAAEQKNAFLAIAFSFAFACCFITFLLCRQKNATNFRYALYPIVTGLCFGGANFCNTVLAGKMKSVIFFPLQNVSTILLSALLGIVLFKEKITLRTAIILILGIIVIVLFSF